jgi:hypothetical protein
MAAFSFYLLLATTLAVFLRGFARRIGYIEFPTLFAAVYLGWVLPQLWDILQHLRTWETDAFILLNLFATLCIVATAAGWRLGVRRPVRPTPPPRTEVTTLVALVLTLVAWGMSFAIGFVDRNTEGTVNWSGPATILLFLASVGVMSLFLSLVLALRRPTPLTLAFVNLALYVAPVLIYFRRAGMAELFLCGVLALWFGRRIALPRVLFLAAIPAGMMVVFAAVALRRIGGEGLASLTDLAAIDFWASTPFGAQASGIDASPELRNALHLARLAHERGEMGLGALSWNSFAFQWIPGQIIGRDLKASLMFDLGIASSFSQAFGYAVSLGTTNTGLGEGFYEFGLLGCVPFGLYAFVLGRWWASAGRGDLGRAVLYAAGLTPAMHSITHYLVYFPTHMLLYWSAYGATLAAAELAIGRHLRARQRPARPRRGGPAPAASSARRTSSQRSTRTPLAKFMR